jgi:hypothetical protein
MLLEQDIRRAASRAAWTAGRSNPTKMPIIAITTSNSTNVNALLFEDETNGSSNRHAINNLQLERNEIRKYRAQARSSRYLSV